MPLNELIRTSTANFGSLAREQGLTLKYAPTEPVQMVLVDPDQLVKAMNNLLRNAIFYTLPGGQVDVSTSLREAKGRTWATVTVMDTGIGIPEKELPYIFDRFFRGEKPRDMQVSGTGLGLSIAEKIIELHGGEITVQSKVNTSTTFTIWLPLVTGQGQIDHNGKDD